MIDVGAWLSTREWYDNHKISTILSCRRKAYLHLVYKGGLAAGVGPGAWFGSAVHAALAVYYKRQGQPDVERRAEAFRVFSRVHSDKFPPEYDYSKDAKHTVDNGCMILDHYFDTFMAEDGLFKPIESELACVTPINPQPGDPARFTKGFYYVSRMDGLWERIHDGSWFVLETKTTSGGADRALTRLAINRQSTGYVHAVKQFPEGERVVGVLANVVSVQTKSRDARRDYFYKNANDISGWRLQTINIICDWREMLARTIDKTDYEAIQETYQNDEHCTNYGLCPYHAICYHGLEMSANVPVNTWTPFHVE